MLETFGLSNICPQIGKGFNRCKYCCFAEQRDSEVLLKSKWAVQPPNKLMSL